MPTITCIYCGLEKDSSEEHIVQRALGGVTVLNTVCEDCNGIFGKGVDEALIVRSPLTIFVRRDLAGASPKTWDIDENGDGLLLEGLPTPGSDSITLLPQLIFDSEEQINYFDGDEIQAHGIEVLSKTFNRRLRSAYHHFKLYGPDARRRDHKKKDMLKFQQTDNVRPKYRYPPRVCCLEPVTAKGPVIFSLRYQNEDDCKKVLDRLAGMNWNASYGSKKFQLGSANPETFIRIHPNSIARAIAKIGFNLLAYHCVATNPCRSTFTRTVEWILEDKHADEFLNLKRHGFIDPSGLADFNCPSDAHKFRLMHDPTKNIWKVYAAFFGGRAAAFAEFSGPNKESWAVMDVVAPIRKHLEPPTFPQWYLPFDTKLARSLGELVPSVPSLNCETHMVREPLPKPRAVK